MLRILNERVYENNGVCADVPLLICLAASNEWPNDQESGKELGALFDRFLFRKHVSPIQSKSGRAKLMWSKSLATEFDQTLSKKEVKDAIAQVESMEWEGTTKDMFERLIDRLNTEGIFPGDRRIRKSVKAVQAYAYLCGEAEVVDRDEYLTILQHTLWDEPVEQPAKVAKIILQTVNPIGMRVNDLILQARDVTTNNEASTAVPKLREIQKQLKELPEHASREKALVFISAEIKREFSKVIGD